MKRLFTVIPAFLLLTGCSIYGTFRHPEPDLEGLAGDVAILADPTDLPQWREVLADQSLHALVDSALSRNTDLRTAALRVQQAGAALAASRMSFLPSLELGASASQDSYSLAAAPSWELDLFGARLNASRQASENKLAAQAGERAVHSSVIASVASSYYYLLLLDHEHATMQEQLSNWKRTISVLEALKANAASVSEADILQARANCLSMESSLVSLESAAKQAQNALRLLLAETPGDVERGSLEKTAVNSWEDGGISLESLKLRPDVEAAEHRMAAAYYALAGSRSAFFPSLTLNGSAGWVASAAGALVSPESWIAGAAAGIVLPVLDGGKRYAGFKSAKAEIEIAQMEFSQTLLNAGTEVNDALTALQAARTKMELDAAQVDYLASAAEKTELLMEHGSVNFLQVLTARNALLSAQQALASDRYDYYCGQVALLRAIGLLK